jgi:hypothetical protein
MCHTGICFVSKCQKLALKKKSNNKVQVQVVNSLTNKVASASDVNDEFILFAIYHQVWPHP